MNPLDLLAILFIVVAVILGWRSGATPQVFGLIGAITGGAAAILSLPYLADQLSGVDPVMRPIVVIIGLVGAVIIGESLGAAIGREIASRFGDGLLSTADRMAGSGLGVVQAMLIVWLAGSLMAAGPVPRLAEAAGGSTAVRTLASILPPPTEIAGELGVFLDATGLPEVFVGFEPLPATPIDPPNDPAARAIAAVAISSTVKVSAATCGMTSVGTGFVVSPGYVVTNAHVVAGAGARGIRVNIDGGRLFDAVPVLFDPDLDVALLRVVDLHARALAFSSRDPERGAVGASLGYPGGGRLAIVPAAVTGRYSATGRDIYGKDKVRREILELRAEIDRGDSGGPLVLTDGTVGGIVFAEARTNEAVGYALSATQVWSRIAPALGRMAPIDLGECIHLER